MNPIDYDKFVGDNVEKGIKTLIFLFEQFVNVMQSGDNVFTETLNTLKIEIDSVNKSMKDLNATAQKKNKQGQDVYYTNLDAWEIESDVSQKNNVPLPKDKDVRPPAADLPGDTDDLPF